MVQYFIYKNQNFQKNTLEQKIKNVLYLKQKKSIIYKLYYFINNRYERRNFLGIAFIVEAYAFKYLYYAINSNSKVKVFYDVLR